ncbi:MAG TPA: MOSC domain-containing protein [Cyanobacteria bacterium UBA8553]|nr:MOSC domain-containing protein [Cyanobacteria bacterium UBA8553]HAJ59403.1 MOSC domain-containing protein [Cyanobacteria bacterium UBA8543]
MSEIKLSGIYIYPIKSAAGISLKTAQVEKRGFECDRRWMLVDETGKFLTQRQFPRMALISVLLNQNQLVVKAPNQKSLSLPIHMDSDDYVRVQVWNSICDAIPLGEEVSQWFSEFLEISCQLVYMPESSFRPVNPRYATDNEQVSFADGFPFLLISEASLEDLNQRLDEPIPMNRFRPNLVVSGCEAFAEDSWRSIRIGSIIFRVVKPCERCSITTVDQALGIRGKEPLQTLAKYRLSNGKILFGQNLIPGKFGALQVGDSVEIDSFAF